MTHSDETLVLSVEPVGGSEIIDGGDTIIVRLTIS